MNWNTDDTDWADNHRFLFVEIRLIRKIGVLKYNDNGKAITQRNY